MIRAKTNKGTDIYISLCDDVGENKGGYYCEVYLNEDEDAIDNFVIHIEDILENPLMPIENFVKEWAKGINEY